MGACGSLTGSHYYLFYNQLNRGQGALGGKGSLAAGWGRVLQMTLMKILLKKFQMLFLYHNLNNRSCKYINILIKKYKKIMLCYVFLNNSVNRAAVAYCSILDDIANVV